MHSGCKDVRRVTNILKNNGTSPNLVLIMLLLSQTQFILLPRLVMFKFHNFSHIIESQLSFKSFQSIQSATQPVP